MSITNAAATNYSNQKKIITLSTGKLVVCYHDTTTNAKFKHSNDGVIWDDYSADVAGAINGSMYAYVDSGGTERLIFIWKQSGTGGSRTDLNLYGMVGSFNATKTILTWGSANLLSNNTPYNYPDVVAHPEGTGGVAHAIFSWANSNPDNFVTWFKIPIDNTGAIGTVTHADVNTASYATNVHTRPSVDMDSSKNLYVAWTAGATGSGKGIRFRKAVYSGGPTWTWNTEREIDSTRKADSADLSEYVICRYDATNSMAMIFFSGDDGTNADLILYQRDAADTTTTTYTLFNDATADNRATYGSMAIDSSNGDVYVFGREETLGTYIRYVKWTRTSSTTGTVGSFTYLDDITFNASYINAIYKTGKIHYVYTVGNSLPYTVKYDALLTTIIANPATSTGTANNTTIKINVTASDLTKTGTANNAVGTQIFYGSAGVATGSGTAYNAQATLPVAHPGVATGTGIANTIKGSTKSNARLASITGVANRSTTKIAPTPVIADVLAESFLTYVLLNWWNSSYMFRHELQIINNWENVGSGHMVEWNFSLLNQYNYGKTRIDYQDVEVIYSSDPDRPVFTVLPRQVTDTSVRFYLVDNLNKGQTSREHYYVYFGNWDLIAPPVRPTFVENLWPISKLTTDKHITYTRPGEYWKDGKATDHRAVATLYFYGQRVRVVSQTSTRSGIAEVSIDGGPWTRVDLYAPITSDQSVFQVTNLTKARHKIQIRPAGVKNPIATSTEINFVSIDYMIPLIVADQGEEVQNVDWASVMSGATV